MAKPSAHARAPWPLCLLGVALALLHLVLAPHVSVFGAVPDFLFAFSACMAFMYGSRAGCVAGFVCGLVADLTGTGPVGLSALLGCVCCYALGTSRRNLLAEGWQAPLTMFSAAAFAYNVLYLALLMALGEGPVLGWAVLGRVLVGTVVDAAVGAAALVVAARFAVPGGRTPGGLRLS